LPHHEEIQKMIRKSCAADEAVEALRDALDRRQRR
jgi:hypothetical protein